MNFPKGIKTTEVIEMMEAGQVTKAETIQFIFDRLNKSFEYAKKTGRIKDLSFSGNYAILTNLDSQYKELIHQHKKAVWPEYNQDFYKKDKPTPATKTAITSEVVKTSQPTKQVANDKPEKTASELAASYATKSDKQLNALLSGRYPAKGEKRELILAELESRKAGTAKPLPVVEVEEIKPDFKSLEATLEAFMASQDPATQAAFAAVFKNKQ